MYRKYNRKTSFSKDRNLTEIESPKDASRPIREQALSDTSSYLVKKTVSGLPRTGSSITPLADPYAIILPGSDPYALVNSLAPKAGGNYGGKQNLDGRASNFRIKLC